MMDWKRLNLAAWRPARRRPTPAFVPPRATELDDAPPPPLPAHPPVEYADLPGEMQPIRMNLEVDEAHHVPVSFNEQTAAAALEVTQRAREYREREKQSIPPVYDFGGGSWSGGHDW